MKNRRWLFAISLLLLAATVLAQEPLKDTEEEREASPAQRQQWFYHQRAYPLKHTPPGAHRRAFGQAVQLRLNEAAARAAAPGGLGAAPAWTLVGPQPASEFNDGVTSGRITAVAIDPTTSGSSTTIFLGGAEGGVWKSVNNGASWTPLTDDQPTLAIGSIAIDPNNHLNVYAGTGEENFSGDSYYGGGLLKSTNGGSTWTMVGQSTFGGPLDGNFGGSYIGSIAIQPGASGTPVILVATEYSSSANGFDSGIYRSTDGGSTWTPVLPSTGSSSATGTSVFFAADGTVYAAIGNIGGNADNGVYKSTDKGATWIAANGSTGHLLPSGTSAGRITLVGAPSNASVLYASIQDPSTYGLLNMYKSTDGGSTWNTILTPLGAPGTTGDFCGGQCWYDMPLAVSPTNANVLYAGGSYNYNQGNGGIYVTTNGGTSGTGAWTTPNPGTNSVYMHPDFHAFAFSADGNTFYLGEDGGIWRGSPTNSLTMAWTDLNAGLAITEFYPGLSIYAGNKNIALNGTQDNGSQLYSGALEWNVVTCGDGAWAAIDFTNSSNMYAGCTSANSLGVLRSLNGGGSWTLFDTGISGSEAVAFIPPMIMDPNNATTLYYGTNHLYKMINSTGTSPTWAYVNSSALTLNGGVLTSIAVTPGNSNNIFIGGSDATVQYSTNAGSSWTHVTSILPGRYVTMVQADPKVATTFYVTFSGFSGFSDTGHVFKCTTTTNSCTDMTGNLPNSPANDIVVDPDLANTFYVATDIGVYVTSNGGSTWSTAGSGLPNVAVVGLKLHEGSRTLRAATHGRSTWDLSVPASSPATMTSPTNGSTLTSSTVTFKWTAGSGVSQYSLYLGSTPGAHDIDFVNAGTNLTATVTNVPTYGGTLYVTLYSLIGGSYQSETYTYTEATGAPVAATMTSPTNGSTLAGSTVTFKWGGGSDVSHYTLYIGTESGSDNIDFVNAGLGTSATVTNIPKNGGTLFVTLYSLIGGSYQSHSYSYIEAGTPSKAALTAPTGNSITGNSATFDWSAGFGVTSYSLYVGTTPGADDLDYFHSNTALTTSVSNLPATGGKIYVTLYSLIDGKWQSNNYTYNNP